MPDLGDRGTKDWSCGDGVRDGLGVGGGGGVNTVRGSLSLQTALSALDPVHLGLQPHEQQATGSNRVVRSHASRPYDVSLLPIALALWVGYRMEKRLLLAPDVGSDEGRELLTC